MYSSILSQHLAASAFPPAVQKMALSITDLTLAFHARISSTFLPTAVKFHYVFNLRDLTNIFQRANSVQAFEFASSTSQLHDSSV
ncbi:unnamed protein product [Dibothriocephalus latus]|uniref:Dynein heavy chain 3 AAA+ lid domain-containing protein n=1 Tax=Dibothriocephalus latus TaxID=60516 RepID=A0A3P6Q784_DIBLA|nr:unnamed protein product [Dibothriocephalus latus]